jgi:hypothetical protein
MEFRDRLTAVLKGRAADRIPFAPYDGTVPRGTFSRELRNRGMGLLCKRGTIESTTPNVTAEVTDEESGISRTFYHTPMGTVSTGFATQRYRFQKKYLIEKREDFTPAIFMVNDTRFHHDDDFYHTETRHLGQDGLVRGNGPEPPYEASEFFFGLETWSYVQYDYPDEFHALLEALEAREVRRIECLLESPAWLVSFGSLSGSYSPALYEKYALPFYRKYVPMLQDRGKACVLHAHNSNITVFSSLIKQTGVKVVEAFTPPPVGDLTLREAREIWGPDTVIWVNFPETIFYSGADAVRQYTTNLLRSDPNPEALVIGFTEMGLSGIDDETEAIFKVGFEVLMDCINDFGGLGAPPS